MVHVWTLEYEGQPENRKVPPLPLLIKKKKKKSLETDKREGDQSFPVLLMLLCYLQIALKIKT